MAPVQSLSIIDRPQEQKQYIKHELFDGHGLHEGAQEEARRQHAQGECKAQICRKYCNMHACNNVV